MERDLAIRRSELLQLRTETNAVQIAQGQRAREIAAGGLDIADSTTWKIVRDPLPLGEITKELLHDWQATNIGVPLSRAMHAALAAEQAAQQILVTSVEDALEKAKQISPELNTRDLIEGYKQTVFYMIDHLFGVVAVNQGIIVNENEKLRMPKTRGRKQLAPLVEDPGQTLYLAYAFAQAIETGAVPFGNMDSEFVLRGARLGRNVFCEIYMQLGTDREAN